MLKTMQAFFEEYKEIEETLDEVREFKRTGSIRNNTATQMDPEFRRKFEAMKAERNRQGVKK